MKQIYSFGRCIGLSASTIDVQTNLVSQVNNGTTDFALADGSPAHSLFEARRPLRQHDFAHF